MNRIDELKRKAAKLHQDDVALLNQIADRDGRITAEEREKHDKMVEDLRSLSETIAGLEEAEARDAELATRQRNDDRDDDNAEGAPTGRASDEQPEFRNFGDFVRAAVNREERVLQMGVGTSGGVLVPTAYVSNVFALDPEDEIIWPQATPVQGEGDPAPDAAVEVPALDQGSSGVLAGVSVVHLAEGGTKTATEPDFTWIRLEPEEVAGYVVVTDKMLRNAPAISTLLEYLLRKALSQQRDQDCFTGDGVGKPLGVQNAPCALTVSRDTASNFKFADVAAMLAAAIPDSWDMLQFVANQTVLPKVVSMADSSGNSIFIAGDVTKGIRPSLLGIPIRFTGRVPVLGTAGDVGLYDFSKYLKRQGSGPFIAKSEHVLWTKNQTVIKAFHNCDGRPWMKAALTLEDGSTQVSPFVILS